MEEGINEEAFKGLWDITWTYKNIVACDCGRYCSESCLLEHENHSQYCALICSVQQIENAK